MSTFWITVIGSVLGATLGGFFTALGAWLQMHALTKQTAENHVNQLKLLELRKKELAMAGVLHLLDEVSREIDNMTTAHRELKRHPSQLGKASISELSSICSRIQKAYVTQRSHLPEPAERLMFDLFCNTGWRDTKWNYFLRVSNDSSYCCNLALWLDAFGNFIHAFIQWLNEARPHVVKGDLYAEVLRTDPIIWTAGARDLDLIYQRSEQLSVQDLRLIWWAW